MGKPLSRPDCLRQSPRCLGKGDEDEAYIEDCYVPQRSIYDTMRINEQIDQGTKLCQPSRTALGSGAEGRGEGSTLSSNGTIGAELGGVFVCRTVENAGAVKKLDERVIFDALKLTGDAQIMSPPVVAKRRHQGGDKKENPNRRSWKSFMPPSFPEFAERLELSSAEGAEKRLSGAGSPLSPLQPAPFNLTPSTPTSSTASLTPYAPSPLSSAPHTPPVSISPSLTPTLSPFSSKAAIRHIPEETFEAIKNSDSERESPLLDQDQGDSAPLLPPKPVFCPPTKARTWPRSITTGKRTQASLRHNFPVLPPLPPLLGEDNSTDEESLYLLDPPSPFLREEEGFLYGGLPLSPCISQEGNGEGLLGWASPGGELRERTASELKFEEDERRILEELQDEEQEQISIKAKEKGAVEKKERALIEKEMNEREEREWEAVLKMENREQITQSWDRENLEVEGWDLTASSGNWPLLTPPTGFEGLRAPSASPCLSSGAESDDLFLELERQCQEEEGIEMSVDSEPLCDPYSLSCLEAEVKKEEEKSICVDFKEMLLQDSVTSAEPGYVALEKTSPKHIYIENSDSKKAQDHQKEHGFIDEDFDFMDEDAVKMEEEEKSFPTDSALGQQLESDSSGAFVVQLDRTGLSDVTQVCDDHRPTQSETDLDSGASSEHDEVDCEETAPSSCHSPLNPYAEEQIKLNELKTDEESPTEGSMNDKFASSLNNGKGVLLDDSLEPQHMTEKDIDSECKQDFDPQPFCGDEAVSLRSSEPFMVTDCDTEGTSVVSDTENLVSICDVASGLNMPDQASDLETAAGVIAGTPKPDSSVLALLQPSVPSSSLSPSSVTSDACGAQSKDFEAFVMSDSFVYLAVSVPAQYPSDCPPSPLGDSIPPSPILKVPCCQDPGGEEDEGGFILSPDSFVYMAAPERPQPSSSDIGSACEETQEVDLDSYSEGNQSGLDGVEFFLGSVTGDSDWESDGSTLDSPGVVSRGQEWDQLEPGLLQNLFAQSDTSQQSQACVPVLDAYQSVVPPFSTDLETAPDSKNRENKPASIPYSETETQLEVCSSLWIHLILQFGDNFMKVGLSKSCKLFQRSLFTYFL
uniref:Uncharacterized protein n=1 Tax=Oryzias latipes TaxID=8090 RepID=A0A3B3ID65_ORYLA